MRFFDRKEEIEMLHEVRRRSEHVAQFTLVTGRRRIGKTSLVAEAYRDTSFLYFFVARKSEQELCRDFQQEIERKLGIVTFGQPAQFAEIFEQVMRLARQQPVTLFIDEFQDFQRVNKSVCSDMQRIWDTNKQEARINLVVCGSVNSLMNKIFKDGKEPLFGRQTGEIRVRPFPPSVLKEILAEYAPGYTSEDLLALYAFTGGVAKYVEHLVDQGAVSLSRMLDVICRRDSLFVNEGKMTLIEEFGKDYGIYFSILTAIATGHHRRHEIETVVGKEVGGYLTKLEDDYGLVRRHQPLFEKSVSSNMKYILADNFYIFWFRFVHRYSYMVEIGAYDMLREVIDRDYDAFSGRALERYFRDKSVESRAFTRVGAWWNRKGTGDIDLIAENELRKTATFYEIKRQPGKFQPSVLEERKNAFLAATHQFGGYAISCQGLSMADM